MNKIMVFTVTAAVALSAAPTSALEWTPMGPRAMGMGGAGVADAQGPLAAYWNPAALGRPSMNSYGLAIPFSFEANVQGPVVAGAKDFQTAKNDCENGSANCQTEIANALNEFNHPGEGLNVDAGGGANLKIGKLDFFLNAFVVGAAEPFSVDTTHVNQLTIQNNTSSLVIKGARVLELGAGYGHELPIPGFYLGGDIKVMRAEVGFDQFSVVNNGSGNSSNLTANTQNSGNFGVDVGALWDLDKTFNGAFWRPRLGVTGHNLNNPKFDEPTMAQQAGFQYFRMNPQWRTGLSFSPANWWHFAADADLTKNLTPLDGFRSQEIGVGTEINVFNRSWINIPLRVGVKHNMAVANDGAVYTLGSGINLLHLMIDASAEAGNQSIVLQSQSKNQSIPREVGASVQISFLFGGAEEKHEHASAAEEQQPVSANQNRGGDMDPSAADRVRADADKAQQELNNQSAPSAD